jgi:sugar phosphate isomerase/epimerase
VRLSIFSDEINPDPARALHLAAAWGISQIEVRSLPGGRFPQVDDAELVRFEHLLAEHGVGVSGVSPGFFKEEIDDPAVPRLLCEALPRACEWAQRLGTDRVSCFGFRRGDASKVPVAVIDRLGEMAAITTAHGCRLSLENEAVCWGDTGLEAAAIIRQIGAPGLGLLWDPGNSARAGSRCPYPDEYLAVRDLVTHVHVKNYDPAAKAWSLVERGMIDWPGQLRALVEDRYDGALVIETHTRISPDEFAVIDGDLDGLEANSRRNLGFVRACLGE